MIVSVLFYDPLTNSYSGNRYTYYCKIPVVKYQKVLAPVQDGNRLSFKKALIIETDLPVSTIDDLWRHKVKTITQTDL